MSNTAKPGLLNVKAKQESWCNFIPIVPLSAGGWAHKPPPAAYDQTTLPPPGPAVEGARAGVPGPDGQAAQPRHGHGGQPQGRLQHRGRGDDGAGQQHGTPGYYGGGTDSLAVVGADCQAAGVQGALEDQARVALEGSEDAPIKD